MSKAPTQAKKPVDDGNFDKEVISRWPDLELAQTRFMLNHPEVDASVKEAKLAKLQQDIKENDMVPFYELVRQDFKIAIDETQLAAMKTANTKRIAEITAEVEDAKNKHRETEVRQGLLRKFEYYCQIGDKENAQKAYTATYEKTVGMGYRIDLVFAMIRVGFFFLDHHLINKYITKAKELMEQGGDWERKNRLRSYEALYRMSVRDFAGAADLFLEAVPTFGSYELMTYENLILYTVITTTFALDRPDLRTKVIRCNEVQEQLTGGGINETLQQLRKYLYAYLGQHYRNFFCLLDAMESKLFKFNRYLSPHFNYYSRGMRQRAYNQFLTPYKTVPIDMMAKDFGVSSSFLQQDIFNMINSGHLQWDLNTANGMIENNYVETEAHKYDVSGETVSQVEARQAAGLIVKMIQEGKIAGRALLVIGEPGAGKTALAIAISKELGVDTPFVSIVASEIYSTEINKTEALTQAIRRVQTLKYKDETEVLEGEVISLKVDRPSDVLSPKVGILKLRTTEMQEAYEIRSKMVDACIKEQIIPGDVIQVDKASGRVTRLGRSFDIDEAYYNDNVLKPRVKLVQCPNGNVQKSVESVQTVCLHDIDVINSHPKGYVALFSGDTGEIKAEVRDQINKKVLELLSKKVASFVPGVLFIDEAHMLDIECFSFLKKAIEGERSPLIIMATNKLNEKVRGTDVESAHGIPSEFLDRLLIIKAIKANLPMALPFGHPGMQNHPPLMPTSFRYPGMPMPMNPSQAPGSSQDGTGMAGPSTRPHQ